MRKSVLAMAAVAAMGVVGSANAGWFVIQNASASGGNGGTLPVNGTRMDVANLGIANSTGNTLQPLSGTDFAAITGSLGGALSVNTLTYFGLENGAQGPAFFGFAYSATENITFNVNMNHAGTPSNAAGSGVLVGVSSDNGATAPSSLGTYGDLSNTYSATAPLSLSTGETIIVLFAGLQATSRVAGSFDLVSGPTGYTMDISYLSFDAGSWSSVGGIGSATASQLNISTYTIPVPAPMLLAGAGLIGAAALRRRMVKKA
jgi:hypothetical protein